MYRVEFKRDIYIKGKFVATIDDGGYDVRSIDFDILEDILCWIDDDLTHFGADDIDLENLKKVVDNLEIEVEFYEQIFENGEYLDGDRGLLSDYFKVRGIR